MSLRNANEALTLSRDTADRAVEAQALHIIGDSYYGLGDLKRSLDFCRQSLLLWQQLGDYSRQAQA